MQRIFLPISREKHPLRKCQHLDHDALVMPILIFVELTYLYKVDWQGGVEEQAIADLEEIRGIPPCKFSDSDVFLCMYVYVCMYVCMYVCTVFRCISIESLKWGPAVIHSNAFVN